MKMITVKNAIKKLEERRRFTLGLWKTMDRVGVNLNMISPSLFKDAADADVHSLEIMRFLLGLPKTKILNTDIIGDIQNTLKRLDEIQESIIKDLPLHYRKKIEELLPVGELIVDDKEIYEDLSH